jgi:hypothetical protein
MSSVYIDSTTRTLTTKNMILSSLFLESLVVSTLASPALVTKRLANPYLNNRCRTMSSEPMRFIQQAPTQSPSSNNIHTTMASSSGSDDSAYRSKLGDVYRFKLGSDFMSRKSPASGYKRTVSDATVSGYKRTVSDVACAPHQTSVFKPVLGPVGVSDKRVDQFPWNTKWCTVVETICEAYHDLGADCSERAYVDATFFKLYALGIPCIRERTLYATEVGVTISKGRIDMEVMGKFLLEFKIVEPTPKNVRKATRQTQRYMRCYIENGNPMQQAAVVFLFGGEVRVVDVQPTGDKMMRYKPY